MIEEIHFKIAKSIKMSDLDTSIKLYQELLVFYESGNPKIKILIQNKLKKLHQLNNI